MYLLQLVQALKYENFSDIQGGLEGGLEPVGKKDDQGLGDESTLDRSVLRWETVVAILTVSESTLPATN